MNCPLCGKTLVADYYCNTIYHDYFHYVNHIDLNESERFVINNYFIIYYHNENKTFIVPIINNKLIYENQFIFDGKIINTNKIDKIKVFL